MAILPAKALVTALAAGDTLAGVQGGKVLQFPRSLLEASVLAQVPRPTRIVYASTAGVVFDYNPATGAGTDNTALVNSIVGPGNVYLLMDGLALVDYVAPGSNVTIEGAWLGCGFAKKGSARGGTGRPLIRNAHPVPGPTASTDSNICLRGLYLDGARRLYGSGNTGANSNFTSAYLRAICNDSGIVIPTLAMYGVNGLVIEDVTVYDSPAYKLHLANLPAGTWRVRNFQGWTSAADLTAGTLTGNDVIHFSGYVGAGVIESPSGSCSDDAFGLCADDGNETGDPTQASLDLTAVAFGPIDGVTIRGSRISACAQVARFLSGRVANSIKNITFEDTQASLSGLANGFGYSGFLFDDFGIGDGSHGLTDGVVINNTKLTGNVTDGSYPIGIVRANVKRLDVNGFRNLTVGQGPTSVANLFSAASPGTFGRVVMTDIADETATPVFPSINLAQAAGGSFSIDGVGLDLSVAGPGYTAPHFEDIPIIKVTGPLDRMMVTNAHGAGIGHLLKFTGVAPNDLLVTDSSLRGSKGGGLIVGDTAFPKLCYAGLDGDILTGIPGGSVVKAESTGWYSSLLLRQVATGVANGTLLAGLVSSNAVAWGGYIGSDTLKVTTGPFATDCYLYCDGGSCGVPAGASAQPASNNTSFVVEADFFVKSTLTSTDMISMILFADSLTSPSEFYEFYLSGTQFGVMKGNFSVVYQTSNAIPAVGAWKRIRCVVNSSGNNRTVKTYVSTDGGRTYTSLMSDATFTTSAAVPAVMAYAYTTTGGSVNTGPRMGNIAVMLP